MLFLAGSKASAIPFDPPPNFFDAHKPASVEDIGEPTTACFFTCPMWILLDGIFPFAISFLFTSFCLFYRFFFLVTHSQLIGGCLKNMME